MPSIIIALVLLFSACGNPKDTKQTVKKEASSIKVETNEGTVVAHGRVVKKFQQTIVPVNKTKLKQFYIWEKKSTEFLKSYPSTGSKSLLKQYDKAFELWQKSTKKLYSKQDVTCILGAYLGQRMVDDLAMEWVMVTDQYGEDYAVQHKKFKFVAFPFSTVLKRIDKNEYHFMHSIYYIIKHRLELKEKATYIASQQKKSGD